MSDPRAALEAIGVLPDTEIDIGDAALQLARIDAPDADWQAARAHLSDLARDAVDLANTIGTNDLSMRAEALAGLHRRAVRICRRRADIRRSRQRQPDQCHRASPGACRSLWASSGCTPRRAAGWGAHGVDFPGAFPGRTGGQERAGGARRVRWRRHAGRARSARAAEAGGGREAPSCARGCCGR